MKKPLVIGIAGGTGSGKTSLTKRLVQRFPGEISVINHDNYYKAHHDLPYEERCKINYDEPAAFDTELLVEDIRSLRQGKSIICPQYDYTIHDRSDKTVLIRPSSAILVEGILLFADKMLRDELDIKIFVDTDADERILRRIRRDMRDRGRTLESITAQYLESVKPMHERYVEPSKKFADMIIPGGGHNIVALDMVTNRIIAHINSEK